MTDVRRNHALCEPCYAGMVDVGEARPDPKYIDPEYRIPVRCCACRTTTTSGLFLDADMFRFAEAIGGLAGVCWDGDPDGFRSIVSEIRANYNAVVGAPAPLGRSR